MVSHAHVTVNGKRLSIPSHKVAVGDVISIKEGSKGSALFATAPKQLLRLRLLLGLP